MESPLSDQAFRGDMEVQSHNEALALTRAEQAPKSDIVVRHSMGRRPTDVVWLTFSAPVIFHNRVIDLLIAKGFSGWSTYPVIIYGRRGEVFKGYSGFGFRGRCGPLDDSRSEAVEREFPGGKFRVLKGLFFDPASWDGSDFFMSSDGSGHKFVTQAVRNCFEEAKVDQMRLERLTEVERPWWKS
jgi:hypothetical protein